MTPLITVPAVTVETVRDEPRRVDGTVRELTMSVDPTPFINCTFVVETVEADKVDEIVTAFDTSVLPVSVKNDTFVADKFVARRVDAVASLTEKTLLFSVDAPIDSNVIEGKRSVEALIVHVTISVTTILEVVRLDADRVLTWQVDAVTRSKRELAT
jgi:hypothetical protein